MQGVWVRDAPFVSLLLQEVKEVFDSQGRAVERNAEDGLKEVIQELLKSSLSTKRRKRWSYMSRKTPSWDAGGFSPEVWGGSDVLLTKKNTFSGVYLGGKQACQVDLRQDLLAVAVPV